MFAVLHIADFALHAVLRNHADADTRPAALLDGEKKKALIVACNDAARANAVAPGQTGPQALAHCATLQLYTRQASAETEARAALLATCFTLSPKVELTADGIATADVGALDVARRRALLDAAIEHLAALGLPATGGLAATPLLALYAARGARAAGQRVCVITNARRFLAPLSLAAADPEPELAEVLATWGVHTLGALTDLPKREVARRLGPGGLALWERAAGETTRVLRLVEPPQEFSATMEFENEVETLEPLLFVLRRFIDRLALELEAAHIVATTLDLTLALTDDTKHERGFRLPEPTAQADTLFRTLHTHLESLHTDAPIAAVRLHITPARPVQRQQGLFETELRDPHGFAETLARVVAIVGSGRVGTPRAENTHRPDAVVMEAPPAVVAPSAPAPTRPALGLPLRRFRPPLTAHVECEPGGQAPASVWSAGINGAVAEARGPWCGSGDWWENARSWEREEWDVELADGGIYRVARTPAGWIVEGEYD